MSEERLPRKAYLICQKYEIEEVLQREQRQLEELFMTDDREQISDQVDRVEHLGSQLKIIEDRIAREERREAARLAAAEAGEEYQEDSEDEEENNPFSRLTRILNQIRPQQGEDESEDEDEDESEDESEEVGIIDDQNQPFYMNPGIQQQFGHIFANAGAVTPVRRRRRRRPANFLNQPGGQNLFQLLQGPPGDLGQIINNLQAQLGEMNVQIVPVGGGGGGYEVLSELEDVPVPLHSECDSVIPTKVYQELSKDLTTDKNKRCAVCLCDYEPEDQVRHLPCDHLFHPDCIQEWFKANAKCPVCKFDLNSLVETEKVIIPTDRPAFLSDIELFHQAGNN